MCTLVESHFFVSYLTIVPQHGLFAFYCLEILQYCIPPHYRVVAGSFWSLTAPGNLVQGGDESPKRGPMSR